MYKKIFMVFVFSLTLLSVNNAYADESLKMSDAANKIQTISTDKNTKESIKEKGEAPVSLKWDGKEKTIQYSEFLSLLKENKVEYAFLSNKPDEAMEMRIILKNGQKNKVLLLSRTSNSFYDDMKNSSAKIQVLSSFAENIDPNKETSFVDKFSGLGLWFFDLLDSVLRMSIIVVIVVILYLFVMKKFTGLNKRLVNSVKVDVSFDDIQGVDDAKNDVMEVVDFLNNKDNFNKLGAVVPRGILLTGDPGNGKTMLAKAVAKAANADFYQIAGSDFVEMFAGLGASRVRGLFKAAKKSKKAVIFIDEIDAVGKARHSSHNDGEREQTLNQLLVEMDGFDSKEYEILIIAATNRPEVLDEALLRPGRFDRQIVVSKPSQKGRVAILNVYLKKILEKQHLDKEIGGNLDLEALAKITVGFSGAELSNLVNEALIRAAKRKAKFLTQEDLTNARDKMLLGEKRKDIEMIEKEKILTAYHEAGHAVVALEVSIDPVEKVTIVPHKNALGVTLQVPEREAWSLSKEDLNNKLKVLMGGRAAEEIYIGEITTGASNDMEVAFKIARAMVSQWGMSETMGYAGVKELNELSDGLRLKVEQEAIALIKTAYEDAKKILEKRDNVMRRFKGDLMRKEILEKDELVSIWIELTETNPRFFNK